MFCSIVGGDVALILITLLIWLVALHGTLRRARTSASGAMTARSRAGGEHLTGWG